MTMVEHPLLENRVKIKKGQLSEKARDLTTLETLTTISKGYLEHRFPGWEPHRLTPKMPFRPEWDELWDGKEALVSFFDELAALPSFDAVRHGAKASDFRKTSDNGGAAHLLFRPMAQIALAGALGDLLGDGAPNPAVYWSKIREADEDRRFRIDDRSLPWYGTAWDHIAGKMRRGVADQKLVKRLFLHLLGGGTSDEEVRERLRHEFALARIVTADADDAVDITGEVVGHRSSQTPASVVSALPAECWSWLVSKGRINALGVQLRAGHIGGDVEWRERCYRLFRLLGLPPMFRALTGVLNGRSVLLAARLKRRNSLRAKLKRLVSIKLSQVADIIGFRVICQSVAESRAVVAKIDSLGLPTKTKRHDPAPSGYRATHMEVQVDHELPSGQAVKFAIEVQVRTYYQHLWAMRSEAFGEQVKMGSGPARHRDYLDRLSTVIGTWEEESPDTIQRVLPKLAPSGGIAVVRQMPIGWDNRWSSSLSLLPTRLPISWWHGRNSHWEIRCFSPILVASILSRLPIRFMCWAKGWVWYSNHGCRSGSK